MATRKIKEKPPVEEMETEIIYLDDLEEDTKMSMNYKDMDIKAIAAWCVEHNETEWLKKIAETKVPYKQYPRKKDEPRKDKDGNVIVSKKGKVQYTYVADKSQPAKVVMRKPNFMHIKNEFCKKFMPELLPAKKAKENNMYDFIKSL